MKFEKKMLVRMLFVLIIVDINEINGYKIRKTKEDYHNKNHEYNLHKGKKFIWYRKDILKINFNSHLFVIKEGVFIEGDKVILNVLNFLV
jgi:hypothetical protein